MIRLASWTSTPRQSRIAALWDKYRSVKATVEELHRKSKWPAAAEPQRIALELEQLEPMLRSLDDLAKEIAEMPATSRNDIQIKARVLLDYLDDKEPDAAQRLALSLCSSVLAVR